MAKSGKQRQSDYNDRLKTAGRARVTITLSDRLAGLLRDLAVRHGKTHGDVVELGILAANKALAAVETVPATSGASPALTRPATALADLQAQMAELQAAEQEDAPPPMRAAERRALELGLAGEVAK